MAQAYYSPFTVQSGQVPSTQTDFPVCIKPTDARFKTIANGGHVANSSGFDLRPYSDTGLTAALTYELVPNTYDAANGTFEMYVKVASLAVGSIIYLGYGDAALTTDGSSASTWDSNFKGVYHFPNGSSLTLANSATGGSNGTGVGTPTATAGKIDGGVNLVNASTQYVTATSLDFTDITYSLWAKANTFPDGYNAIIFRYNASDFSGIYARSTNRITWYIQQPSGPGAIIDPGTFVFNSATWYHLALTYSNADGMKTYANATSDGTVASGGGNLSTTARTTRFGSQESQVREWDGVLDEIRISDSVRASSWITTEYNNLNAPSSFALLGTEVPIGGGGRFFILTHPA